jgi:hypothetical protein
MGFVKKAYGAVIQMHMALAGQRPGTLREPEISTPVNRADWLKMGAHMMYITKHLSELLNRRVTPTD